MPSRHRLPVAVPSAHSGARSSAAARAASPIRPLALLAALLVALALLVIVAAPARASFQTDIAALVNDARAAEDLDALTSNSDIDAVAQAWAQHLAEAGELSHNPRVWSQIPSGAWGAGENVAYNSAPTAAAMHGQLMNSPDHRANILGNYTHLGVGYAIDDDGGGWLVEVFGRYPDPLPGDRQTGPAEPTPDPTASASPTHGAPPSAGPAPTASATAGPAPTASASATEASTTRGPGAEASAASRVPAGWLAAGSSGPEVLALQQDLVALGYELTPDGRFGTETRDEVEAFQTDAGLEADGMAGPTTLAAIADALAASEATTDPPEDETASEAPPSSTSVEATGTDVTPDIVPADVARPPRGESDVVGLPSTGALVGALGGAGAALAALLMVRRRILARAGGPRHL